VFCHKIKKQSNLGRDDGGVQDGGVHAVIEALVADAIVGEHPGQSARTDVVVHGVVIQQHQAFTQTGELQQGNAVVADMAGFEGNFAQLLLPLEQPGVLIAGQLIGQAVVRQDAFGRLQGGLAGQVGWGGHEMALALEQYAALHAGLHGRRDAEVDIELVAP
jgi:hypothetical protein